MDRLEAALCGGKRPDKSVSKQKDRLIHWQQRNSGIGNGEDQDPTIAVPFHSRHAKEIVRASVDETKPIVERPDTPSMRARLLRCRT